MPQLADRVQETTTTSGTGSVTLAGAVTGYRTFSSAFSVGTSVWYCIVDGANWEVGRGTLSASTTLTRDKVYSSSNSGSAITLSGGTSVVFCTLAQDVAQNAGRGRMVATAGGMNMP